MGSSYRIFGKQVPSHVLAILTLGSAAGVVMYPRGKANATPTPAPVAQTSSEDDFDLEKLINDLSKEETK
ncbi:ATP synthase subunit K, mitochondrial [[Candida] zeylanoides]